MQDDIDANPENLMHQASYTAGIWLRNAVRLVDDEFGEGFAEKNPALLGQMLVASALDQHAMYVKMGAQDIRDALRAIANATEPRD